MMCLVWSWVWEHYGRFELWLELMLISFFQVGKVLMFVEYEKKLKELKKM